MMYVIYNSDGYIKKLLIIHPDHLEYNLEEGDQYLEVDSQVDIEDWYVADGEIAAKTDFPALALPTNPQINTTLTIGNVPAGTYVGWPDGEETTENDGEVSFDVSVGGEYPFILRHPRYKTKSICIDVA